MKFEMISKHYNLLKPNKFNDILLIWIKDLILEIFFIDLHSEKFLPEFLFGAFFIVNHIIHFKFNDLLTALPISG